ncbi:MAG: hemerythrin family protein [Thermodesulfobacteriota bacterium]
MAKFFQWDNRYTVYVPEIDAQHKQLLRQFDAFVEKTLLGAGKQEILGLMGFLSWYCAFHFETEELYMHQFEYPGVTEHKKAHSDLTRRVLEVGTRLKQQDLGSGHVADLVEQVGKWVLHHVFRVDLAMGQHFGALHARGIALRIERASGCGTMAAGFGGGSPWGVPCPCVGVCESMFREFRDPESTNFWRKRYCLTVEYLSCRRKELLDRGTRGSDLPAGLLPNGERLFG